MPPFALTVLKVIFLGLLYFFIWRSFRSVVGGLRPAQPARGGRDRPGRGARPARANGKPPRELVLLDERGNRARTLRLDGQLNIGRADACQVQLGDTYVSQFHARLFPREGGWFVEDLGSTNGTYLNQRRLTSQAAVQAGDRIRVGKTTLELRR